MCVFCLYLYPTDEFRDREARTVKNGQATCFRHLAFVPDATETFEVALDLARRNEAYAASSAARIRT